LGAGFTLVEVLVAVAVLSIGIVAVLQSLDGALLRLDAARDALTASLLVRERMTEARLAASGSGSGLGAGGGTHMESGRAYRWIQAVRQGPEALSGPDSAGPIRIEEVTVTVWREGRARRYSAATYVTRRQDVPGR
jgi:type II secretion system protein I